MSTTSSTLALPRPFTNTKKSLEHNILHARPHHTHRHTQRNLLRTTSSTLALTRPTDTNNDVSQTRNPPITQTHTKKSLEDNVHRSRAHQTPRHTQRTPLTAAPLASAHPEGPRGSQTSAGRRPRGTRGRRKINARSHIMQFFCTPRGQHSARCNTRKTSFLQANATVLLVHTGQNAEHSGPANQGKGIPFHRIFMQN